MVGRACYSSFVTACPRLMEPMLIGEVHCTFECISVIEDLLSRRRGHINSQIAMPGAPFYIVRFVLPALDSFGLETIIELPLKVKQEIKDWKRKQKILILIKIWD